MDMALSTAGVAARFGGSSSRRLLEACALMSAIVANWVIAAEAPSPICSYTSLLLFGWTTLLLIRTAPRAAILMLPFVITRAATMVSLVFIEAGAFMPEVGRAGGPGDASASFAAFSALLYAVYALVFSAMDRPTLRFANSPLIERFSALLRWPIVALCASLLLLALAHGVQTGFPVFQHVDRFYYRRFYSGGLVLELLDDKFLFGALLGAIVFSRRSGSLLRASAGAVQVGLLALFFLFGDKFFTLLTMLTFFFMPYLLRHEFALLRTLVRGWFVASLMLAAAFGATLFIYSDYGDAPLSTGMMKLGERIAGQGELWYVASQDDRRLTAYDDHVAHAYRLSLTAPDPAVSDFQTGVETYYFINRYTPQPLRRSFIRNQGWVQLTMGTEAMALASFGYVGVTMLMVVAGLVLALSALYLRRAFASDFPASIALAILILLQVYIALNQAALWPVLAHGQINRFLLAATFEALLLALNWSQVRRLRERPAVSARAIGA